MHSYISGFQGDEIIADSPVDGAMEWLNQALLDKDLDIQIYSSRSKTPAGIEAMKHWIRVHFYEYGLNYHLLKHLSFPTKRPPAFMSIDDRAFCFKGKFPSIDFIKSFKPWNK